MDNFLTFLDSSPTSFHAVENLIAASGATPFQGKIVPHKTYYVQKGGALLLFRAPKGAIKRASICAAHTDSPGLKLKPQPVVSRDDLFLLSSDVYGGPLLTSWLNRDLVLAGKIIYEQGGKAHEKLIFLKAPIFTIPQLAPHLDPNKEAGLLLNRQDHLYAVLGYYDKKLEGHLLETLLGVKKLIAHELFLVPYEKARVIGLQNDFLASYRLDNLSSCHAILEAFKKAHSPHLAMAVFWDHEEIGSQTDTGALSPLFVDTLERITLALGLSRQEFLDIKDRSQTYSVDVSHAQNPNYQDKMEPAHKNFLGQGPVLKWSTTYRYATTASSSRHLPPLQNFIANANFKGGSTLGPLHATRSGIPTVDLGSPQLSMHSIRELISLKDHQALIELLKTLFET